MKELLEKIFCTPAENYCDDYVENGFVKGYDLIKKLHDKLSEEEFSLLYKMINEQGNELYKFVEYFEYRINQKEIENERI